MIDRTKSNVPVKKWRRPREQKAKATRQRRTAQNELFKNAKLFIGMDNGSTGTMCAIMPQLKYIDFRLTPATRQRNYQKETKYIDRIDWQAFAEWLRTVGRICADAFGEGYGAVVVMQRPMVNPQRFDASLNAVRAFQAMLVVLQQEGLGGNIVVVDSKAWQHQFFGKYTMNLDLKLQSMKAGLKILEEYGNPPQMKEIAIGHGDADGLMIAEYGVLKSDRLNG